MAINKTEAAKLREAEEIIRQKQAKLVLLEREIKLIKRDNDAAAKIRREIYDLSELSPEPPKWIVQRQDPKSSGIPCVLLSDIHKGEKVFRNQVGGMNFYNRHVARDRLETWLRVLLDLTLHHMVKPKYEGLILMLGGDMITGIIHDELRETNDGPVQLSLLELQGELITIITTLADKFGKVFIPCVVGNHGRETPKPRAKFVVYTSYEWNLYCQLEFHFRNDPRVQFFIPEEADAYFTVYGHRYFLTHGDRLGVKGGDGIIGVLGPIARGTIKVGNSEKQVGRDFDTICICHYHTYIPRNDAIRCIVNGSVIGFNEYAHYGLRVPYSPPRQALWFTHPKYGVTAQWKIDLDEKRQPKKTDWITWNDRRRAHEAIPSRPYAGTAGL